MIDNNSGPDFLVIGAEKAGTTFLHRAFRNHPDIHIPYIKELNYFNALKGNYLAKRKRATFKQLFLKKNRLQQYFSPVTGLKEFKWDLNYFMGIPDANWYRRCFINAEKGQIKGELSPAYAVLDEKQVECMRKELGNIKIIFIMRNPVVRDWSQIKMEYNNLNRVAVKENKDINSYIEEFMVSNIFVPKSDYKKTTDRYVRLFGEENVYLGLFEEMIDDPNIFFNKLYDFLNIRFVKPNTSKKVNEGTTRLSMSDRLKKTAYIRHAKTIIYLDELFDNSYTKDMLTLLNKYKDLPIS